MPKRLFSDSQEQEIERQYKEEEVSTYTLGRRYECYPSTIRDIIKRRGGKLRTQSKAISGDKNPNFGVHRFGKDAPMYGKHHSDKTKQKIGIANSGKKRSEATKKKISKKLKGKFCGEKNPNYGKHYSEAIKQKMRDVFKGRISSMKDKHHSEATKRKMREKALLRIQNYSGPFTNTKPELKMKVILNNLGIPFEHQFRLGNHLYDFCVLNTNILIEVDGDYYHGNPKMFKKLSEMQLYQRQRDIKNEKLAKTNNYILLRFWENDILKDEGKVKEKICNVINL